MAPRKNRGADALVASLAAAGVKRIFTLSGNHVMPVFDAALDAGIDLIHVRHEAAAVHMADAYARLTGDVGVAMVTGGPGHANAVSALYTAAMAESPVLLLSGHAPNDQLGMGAFQEMRQAELAAPLCKWTGTSASPDRIAVDLVQAMRAAKSGRPGPVHLSLPQDALDKPADLEALPLRDDFAVTAYAPKAAMAGPMLAALREAKRPLVLVGPAALSRAGRERLAALEAASGIPVVGMESPRGTADPSLGAFAQVLAQADAVLLVGKRLDFTLKFGKPPAFAADCRFLQVDPDPAEIERTRRAVGARLVATAEGDALATVGALESAAHVLGQGDHAWLDDVRAAIAYRPAAWDTATSGEAGRLHPAQALRPLQKVLDAHPDSVFVSDGGEIGQWAQACLAAPNRVLNGVAGSIGSALPFAAGARVAKPGVPVVAVLGDGTFGFHPAEIDTAVRYRLPYVAIVGNDARWNAEYQIQLRDYGRERLVGCELLATRYDQVAQGFGGHGEFVTEAPELMPAVERSIASGKPAVINVMVEGLAAPNVKR